MRSIRGSITSRWRVGCAVLLCMAILPLAVCGTASVLSDLPGVEGSVTLSETEVLFGAGERPTALTVGDSYQFSVRLLRDTGWAGSLRPTSLSIDLRCTTDLDRPELAGLSVHIEQGYVDGILPSVKYAYIGFPKDRDVAHIEIGYVRLSFPEASVDVNKVRVDIWQAFAIGQEFGGKKFYGAMNGRCLVNLTLRRNTWSLRYADATVQTKPQWAGFDILIDAVTGSARRRATP